MRSRCWTDFVYPCLVKISCFIVLAARMTIPVAKRCIFAFLGCVDGSGSHQHAKTCRYRLSTAIDRVVKCPLTNCGVEMAVNRVGVHLGRN